MAKRSSGGTETAETVEVPTNEFTALPDELEAEPFHFNRGMLRELGGCGTYIRKHRELFSPAEFPAGPVINSATTRRYAADFDWGWASGNLLTWRGREEVERIANSRSERYKPLGRGSSSNTARYAAAFGYVFATMPEHRQETVRDLAKRAVQNAERRAQEDLRDAELEIRNAEETIQAAQQTKARLEADLPALRANLENVKVTTAQAVAAAKERDVETARRRLAALETEAATLRATADELAAAKAAEAAQVDPVTGEPPATVEETS